MQQKRITVTLEPDGTSKIDLEGFAGNGCGKVMDDFSAGDRVLVKRRKPEFYSRECDRQVQQGNQ